MSLVSLNFLKRSPVFPLRQPFCLFYVSFYWGWFRSLPLVQSQEPLSIVLQAFCLIKSLESICLFHSNCKGFDLGHAWMSSGFHIFLQFKYEFGNKEFMIWATVRSHSCFCWLYRASLPLAAKNIISLTLVLPCVKFSMDIWWCPCVEISLVLLEEDVCYDQCVLWAKLCFSLPCFILYS